MKTIYLKVIQPYFKELDNNNKTFEYRKNDRNFEIGDIVHLQEYDPSFLLFSGREVVVEITYILKDFFLLPVGYCIFSFHRVIA